MVSEPLSATSRRPADGGASSQNQTRFNPVQQSDRVIVAVNNAFGRATSTHNQSTTALHGSNTQQSPVKTQTSSTPSSHNSVDGSTFTKVYPPYSAQMNGM